MTLIVNGVEKKVEMRTWSESKPGYGPDVSQDVITDVADGSEISEETYRQMVEYVSSEVEDYNAGKYSELLGERKWIEEQDGEVHEYQHDEIVFSAD